MTRAYEKFPELLEAKRNDLRQLSEDKIDKILEFQQVDHQQHKSYSEFQNEAISNKSLFGYIQKSTRTLLSLMNGLKTKKSDTEDAKLNIIIEQNKVLASLIIQQKKNKKQINEMVDDTK